MVLFTRKLVIRCRMISKWILKSFLRKVRIAGFHESELLWEPASLSKQIKPFQTSSLMVWDFQIWAVETDSLENIILDNVLKDNHLKSRVNLLTHGSRTALNLFDMNTITKLPIIWRNTSFYFQAEKSCHLTETFNSETFQDLVYNKNDSLPS